MLNALSRIGVCIFVMISGVLFLGNKRGSSTKSVAKYILKILRLICIWSAFYFVIRLIIGDVTSTDALDLLKQIIYGYYHLWYLWMILGLYIITPILYNVVSDKKLCEYFLLLCSIVCWIPEMLSIAPVWNEFLLTVFQDKMYLFLPMGYTGYYILGYYLCNHKIQKKQRRILLFAGMLGVLYGVVGGILYGKYTGTPSQVTYNNLTLSTVCYSAMAFVLLKDKFENVNFTEKIKNVIYVLGDSTLGIYLVHVVFVRGFSDRFMMITHYKYPLCSIFIALIIFSVSFFITRVLKKIPIIGKWLV